MRALFLMILALGLTACDGCSGRASSQGMRPGVARPPATGPQGTPGAQAPSARAPGITSAAPAAILPAEEHTWVYPESSVGLMHVVVSVPKRHQKQRFPVLIALHGRGEALKGPARGARGWIDDYWLPRAIERLHHPPLRSVDLLGFVEAQRLAALNADLAKRPYQGLVVVCPYTPDIWHGGQPFSAAEPLTRFVVDELLPRVRRETPAIATTAATGIDGVSLGGRAALLLGLGRPQAFGAVATLQPAFSSADAPALATLAQQAKKQNPALRVRLLTSLEDYYLQSTRRISEALRDAGVQNRLDVVPGPHDYDFNRGPGAYEMLMFHDRALRGQPAP